MFQHARGLLSGNVVDEHQLRVEVGGRVQHMLQARVEGGVLKVGPESAGADPGPVAYGRGR